MHRLRLSMKTKVAVFVAVACACGILLWVPKHRAVRALSAYDRLTPLQQRLLSGFAANELNPSAIEPTAAVTGFAPLANAPAYFPASSSTGAYSAGGKGECDGKIGSNVKMNQNCSNLSDPDLQGRAQANNEPAIAQDPNHSEHIVATDNDYRRGDGACMAGFSQSNGSDWNDSTVPVGFTRGSAFGAAREYWQASGDTSVAWDTKGNAYISCQTFQRGFPSSSSRDLSSAVYVLRSTGNKGASWNFPARPVVQANDVAGSGTILEDKPYMTVDNHGGSPFQDRIYVTWTEFAADGSAYIWESYSQDYGQSFSSRVLVSGGSPLCPVTYGIATAHGNCNENQFSQPFTGPDGALYVVYANFNNAVSSSSDNHNQMLIVKSTDGGSTFGAPVKVGNYYDLPDCATYQGNQNFGRACVPEKGPAQTSVFRASNYPAGAVNPANPSQVVVTFGSYINPHSKESNGCVPAGFSASTGNNLYTGVKTPGACNNDILISVSTNGGGTFTGTATDPRSLTSVNQDPGQAVTDQWFQWVAFSEGGKLAVSYYDRQYGSDEMTGFMDVSLSGSKDNIKFGTRRVTSSSMPVPTQFADAQGWSLFFGDYTGLSVGEETAHPVWSDTRNPELFLCPGTAVPGLPPAVCTASFGSAGIANEQEIYTDSLGIPAP